MRGHDFPKQKDARYEADMMNKYSLLVHKICHRYAGMMPYEDLYQEGCIGLLYAIRWYQDKTNVPFIKTASLLIRTYIMKGVYRNQGVHISQRDCQKGIMNVVDLVDLSALDDVEDANLKADMLNTAMMLLDDKEYDACILTKKEFQTKYHSKDYDDVRNCAIQRLKEDFGL